MLSVCLGHSPLCFDTGSHWQVPMVCLSLVPPGIGLQMCVAGWMLHVFWDSGLWSSLAQHHLLTTLSAVWPVVHAGI